MERCTPPNPQGYAGRYAPLHPALPFLCERKPSPTKLGYQKAHLRGAEQHAAQLKSVRSALADCAPLKISLFLGGLPRKIDLLQPREGIRASGKMDYPVLSKFTPSSRGGFLRGHSQLTLTVLTSTVPRAVRPPLNVLFRPLFSHKKEGAGCRGAQRPA